ncbi:MAG TPA: sugar transferase [Thermoanaerobaculia bacterium]|nr:sugar transferase [Thermoanaerobaculia bacterium]
MLDRRKLLVTILQVGDLLVMLCAFALAMVASGLASDGPDRLRQFFAVRVSVGNVLGLAGFALFWHVVFRSLGLYRSRRIGSLFREWVGIFKGALLGFLALPALALMFDVTAIDRRFLAVFFVAVVVATCLERAVMRSLLSEVRRKGRNLRNVVIVGCGERGAAVGRQLRQRTDLGYLLLGYIDDLAAPDSPAHGGSEKLLGPLEQAEEILAAGEIDEIYVTLPIKTYYQRIAEIISAAEDLGISVRMPADFFNLEVSRAEVDYLDNLPIMTMTSPAPSAGALLLKRVLDVAAATVALAVLSPLLALVAVAIRVDSAGPVFFTQSRIGQGRRRFRMAKFRTMAVDAEARLQEVAHLNECRGAAFKMENDPRITRVGRWLRRLSIDELPQLWNVLVGEMSLVGPRPLPDRDVQGFDQRWLNRRFSVKPGLTCLWQANGRHNIDFDEWMELDLQYIDQWSLSLDFEIMLKTVPAVLRGTGAS